MPKARWQGCPAPSAPLAALVPPRKAAAPAFGKSRNLFIRPGAHGGEEIAAIDWGDCGLAPLGGELAMLVSGTVFVLV